MRSLSLALVAALLVAGCSGASAPLSEPTETTEETPVVTHQGTETPMTTATDRPNPWNETTLTVAVDASTTGDREVDYLIRHATAYWSKQSEAFAGYFVTFEVKPNAENPDIVVAFKEDPGECGHVDDPAGCAPFINSSAVIDRPVRVTIEAGLADESTEHVLKHEFGHLLGIEHGDPPRDVMDADTTLHTVPKPNATQRIFPWPDRQFTVYTDLGSAPDTAAAEGQVDHALDYFAEGAVSAPTNLSFERVDSPEQADVVVRYRDAKACNKEIRSCFVTTGTDPDGDGAIEQYRTVTITLYGVDTAAIGWHVGNWLAYVFGAEAKAQRPPPFRDASYEERRSEWWTDE